MSLNELLHDPQTWTFAVAILGFLALILAVPGDASMPPRDKDDDDPFPPIFPPF